MKNLIKIFMLIGICFFVLCGCINSELDTANKIKAPNNSIIPIEGTWNIEKYKLINSGENQNSVLNKYIDKKAQFTEEYSSLGDDVSSNPEYKIKKVPANKFFLYTYKINPKELGVHTEDIEVITITSAGKLFYEVIRLDSDSLLINVDKGFLYLKKLSNETNLSILNHKSSRELSHKYESKEPELLRTGLLLGLSSYTGSNYKDSLNESGHKSYRTLWIQSKNREISSIMNIDNILMPRKNGFWIVGINTTKEGPYSKDAFFTEVLDGNGVERKPQELSDPNEIQKKEVIYNKNNLNNQLPIKSDSDFKEMELGIDGIDKEKEGLHSKDIIYGDIYRRLLFLGNDYIVSEYTRVSNEDKSIYNRLKVLPVDNVDSDKEVNISDIFGEEGKEALMASGELAFSSLNQNVSKDLHKLPEESSFKMERRNGHWILKGRLRPKNNNSEKYLDFNINYFPTSKIVNYDELYIPWSKIKERVPDARDAFTSPNKDIAIIIRKNTIDIYDIKNYELGNKPLKVIEKKEDEGVIMAEWATGNYVEKWSNVAKSRVEQSQNNK